MRAPRSLCWVIAAIATTDVAAAQTVGLKFQSGPASPSLTADGYYGPFSGTVMSNPTLPTISLYCVDVLNRVKWGQQWTANVSSLTGSLALTRHGDEKRLQYQKAAWLTTQYSLNATTEWAGIQAAIWNLLNPGKPNGGAAEQYWLSQASTFASGSAFDRYDWGNFRIMTDVGAAGRAQGGGAREFITIHDPHVTPEPATIVLLVSGLVGVVGFVVVRGVRV